MYSIGDLNNMSHAINKGLPDAPADIIESRLINCNHWSDYDSREEFKELIAFLVKYDINYVTLNRLIIISHDDYIKILDILNSNT